jgi:hypothetical protein
MKRKTIVKVLNGVVSNWIKSIKYKEARELLSENVIVTGGSIASMLLGEEVNDYDLYFKTQEATTLAATYYTDIANEQEGEWCGVRVDDDTGSVKIYTLSDSRHIQDGGVKVKWSKKQTEKGKYLPVYMTDNAISLTQDVQLVLRFYGSPEEIHTNYDFVHCTNYFDFSTQKLELRADAMEALLSKTLQYQGSKYPLCSILRTKKFIERGWNINAGQYLKMCMQLNDMDLRDIDVLREQLIGVDSLYFQRFLRLLSPVSGEGDQVNLRAVDHSQLCELIDKVFE